jgi:hypothetical protein
LDIHFLIIHILFYFYFGIFIIDFWSIFCNKWPMNGLVQINGPPVLSHNLD